VVPDPGGPDPYAGPASYYDVLGIDPAATHEEVRHAYIERALRYHPDRQRDAGEADRVLAARRMQDVNEAWSVLGDAVARAAYDAEVGLPPAAPPAAGADGDRAEGPSWRHLLPVAVVLAVLLAVFVFTAYARTPG
jgi:DnaJ-class molecular chaperone